MSNSTKRAAIVIRQLEKNTGAARNAFEQIRLLQREGYKVDVIGQKLDKKKIRDYGATPVQVRIFFKKGYKRRIAFENKVSSILKRRNYNLVLGHGDNFSQDVLFLHNCVHLASELVHGKKLSSTDSVGRLHEEMISKGDYKLLIANSRAMKRDLVDRFGVDESKIEVLYQGFSPSEFDVDQKSEWREKIRKNLGLSDDKLLIGLVTSGAFAKRNVDLFIRAISKIDEKLKAKCNFVIVGRDPLEAELRKKSR